VTEAIERPAGQMVAVERDVERRIRDAVDRRMDYAVALLSRAIQIPSINPTYPGQDFAAVVGGEARVATLFAEAYRAAGAESEVFGSVPGRDNAVARIAGAGGGPSLLFNGHLDVVPPGPSAEWTGEDPWSGRVADGRVWGRGACDMKGGLVAQATAARALGEAGVRLRGDLVLHAVVGEEMMEHGLGTTACVERGYRADAAIVAEPSAPPEPLAICPISPGVVSFTVSVEGKATHTALRGETVRPGGLGEAVGVSAIDKLFLLYQALEQLETAWRTSKVHPLFAPGHFAILPGVVVGGPRSGLVPFAVPDEARLEAVAWYHPDEVVDDVRGEIEASLARAAKADRWLRAHPPRVDWRHHWPPSTLDPAHPVVTATMDAHRRATGGPAALRGFLAVDDATWLNAAGIPAISYGPGDLRSAHAVDEHVAIDELRTATLTFALLAAGWCGVAESGE
jgi:acetylornithine deacetylase